MPKAHADEPIYAFETGGSTGLPKYRINIRDFHTDYALYSESLSEEDFPKGADWLMLGPSGRYYNTALVAEQVNRQSHLPPQPFLTGCK